MNLYKISQSENNNYDTYDSAVVAAETGDAAKRTHPSGDNTNWGVCYDTWCGGPDAVTAELIGVAGDGIGAGVVLASYNAG